MRLPTSPELIPSNRPRIEPESYFLPPPRRYGEWSRHIQIWNIHRHFYCKKSPKNPPLSQKIGEKGSSFLTRFIEVPGYRSRSEFWSCRRRRPQRAQVFIKIIHFFCLNRFSCLCMSHSVCACFVIPQVHRMDTPSPGTNSIGAAFALRVSASRALASLGCRGQDFATRGETSSSQIWPLESATWFFSSLDATEGEISCSQLQSPTTNTLHLSWLQHHCHRGRAVRSLSSFVPPFL